MNGDAELKALGVQSAVVAAYIVSDDGSILLEVLSLVQAAAAGYAGVTDAGGSLADLVHLVETYSICS